MVLPGICGLNEDKGLWLPGPCATKRVEPTPDKPLRSWSGSLDQEECDQLVELNLLVKLRALYVKQAESALKELSHRQVRES